MEHDNELEYFQNKLPFLNNLIEYDMKKISANPLSIGYRLQGILIQCLDPTHSSNRKRRRE